MAPTVMADSPNFDIDAESLPAQAQPGHDRTQQQEDWQPYVDRPPAPSERRGRRRRRRRANVLGLDPPQALQAVVDFDPRWKRRREDVIRDVFVDLDIGDSSDSQDSDGSPPQPIVTDVAVATHIVNGQRSSLERSNLADGVS